MKSEKLNEFLSSCNKLETLDCYYWKDYVIGEQYEINYKSLQEDVLNEITTNLYSLQSNQANIYFHQLFQTIEKVISNKDLKHFSTFSEDAKEDYEFQLYFLKNEHPQYLEDEKLDNEIEYLLYTPFEEIFKDIFKERLKKRLDLINSVKLKIERIKSIYFDGINKEFKPSIDTIDKIDIDKTKTSTTEESIEIDELNKIKIKEDINSVVNDKIKWKGKPSQFGHLILELIGKEWIELPTKSYNKSAEFLLNLFDIDTTKGNLSKEINPNETGGNSLTPDSQSFFKVKDNKKN
jgi:hypothetical protein